MIKKMTKLPENLSEKLIFKNGKEGQMEKESTHFEAQMTFDDDTIRRMFRAEYYSYETAQRLIRFVLGAAGVLAALFLDIHTGARVVFLMFGVWMLVAGDFPSKVQAEGVIEKRGGKSSHVSYVLDGTGIRIRGGGCIPYQALDKLVYDEEYLYLFAGRQNAVMICMDRLKPSDPEALKAFVAEKSGKSWKRLTTGILEYNLKDFLQAFGGRKKESNG